MPLQHYMQIRVNFAHGGGHLGRGDDVEVAPRHSAVVNFVPGARPTRFHGFQSSLVCGSPYRILSPPSSGSFTLTLVLPPSSRIFAPCLIRGSLIRARGRARRSVLLRLVGLALNARRSPFSISLSRACTRTPKSTRAFKALQSRGPLEANAFDR